MSRFTIVALVLGCGTSLASSAPLNPAVSQSSKKFFGKDYPNDYHAVANKYLHFGHPYPAVQDGGDFDTDFVKDENKDGGQWAAQMEYDRLRHKVTQAEKELEALKKKMDRQALEVQAADDKWHEAVDKVEEAKADTDEAKRAEVAADGTVNNVQDEVKDLAKNVEKEMKDLEGCKKALEDAKQRLKDLLDKQKELARKAEEEREAALTNEQREVEMKKKVEAKKQMDEKNVEEKKKVEEEMKKREVARKQEEAEKKREEEVKRINEEHKKAMSEHERQMAEYAEEMAEYEKDMDKYNKKVKEIEAAIADRDQKRAEQKAAVAQAIAHKKDMDATWQSKIAEDKSEYAAASKDYDQAVQKVHDTEAELEKAAAVLKKYRRAPHVDDNGGVYNVPDRSFAAPVGLSGVAMMAFLAVSAW